MSSPSMPWPRIISKPISARARRTASTWSWRRDRLIRPVPTQARQALPSWAIGWSGIVVTTVLLSVGGRANRSPPVGGRAVRGRSVGGALARLVDRLHVGTHVHRLELGDVGVPLGQVTLAEDEGRGVLVHVVLQRALPQGHLLPLQLVERGGRGQLELGLGAHRLLELHHLVTQHRAGAVVGD